MCSGSAAEERAVAAGEYNGQVGGLDAWGAVDNLIHASVLLDQGALGEAPLDPGVGDAHGEKL